MSTGIQTGRNAELLGRIHTTARLVVAAVWIWHGLVPKILVRDPVEIAPILPLGISEEDAWTIVTITGCAEILFGLLTLLLRSARWPLVVTIVVMAGLLLGVLVTEPGLVGGAFNPLTLNLAVATLAAVGLTALQGKRDQIEA